ncbi:MAG: hypothetical protein ABSH48_25455, partial [Verrucomicrobiota bacterium]
SGQQFIALSKITVLQALVGTLVLPLLPLMGYYGACLRTGVISVANMFLLHRQRPMRISPRLDWPGFRDVIRIGLPLSGAGYIAWSLPISLEGTAVLGWFGVKMLGLYSMAVFVRTVFVQLTLNMTQVINVNIYEQYGRSGRVRDCVRLIFLPTALAFLASLPLIVLGWLTLPWAATLLIPKYVEAVPMMRLTLLVLPVMFLSLPVTILWATGRCTDCYLGVTAGFLTFAGLSWFLHRLNFGASGILVAYTLGKATHVLVSYILIIKLVLKEERSPAPCAIQIATQAAKWK